MSRPLAIAFALWSSTALLTAAPHRSRGADPARVVEPRQAAAPRVELTVDSIMRGLTLVGYPPSGLRWAGDSRTLYFDWRRPGESERDAGVYAVSRDGGAPKRLSDEERRLAPPRDGVWDGRRRRALFVDDGDIVLVDSMAPARTQITRTTAPEQNPRWARSATHVTFVRDNNLFIVPVEGSTAGLVVQLTDVSPRKSEPQPTDSQKFLKEEERKLIEHVRVEAARKEKEEADRKKRALPPFELGERQSVTDLALTLDETYVLQNAGMHNAQMHNAELNTET